MAFTGKPDDAYNAVKNAVLGFAKRTNVKEFYIGRTVDTAATRSRHGAEEVVPLYETDSLAHAQDIEDWLINDFIDHPKNSNEAEHSGGGTSEDYRQFVYIALWFN